MTSKRTSNAISAPKTDRLSVEACDDPEDEAFAAAAQGSSHGDATVYNATKLLKRLRSSDASSDSPLLWMIGSDDIACDQSELIKQWHNTITSDGHPDETIAQFADAVDSIAGHPASLGEALVVLAACHGLATLADTLPMEKWQTVGAQLLAVPNSEFSGDSNILVDQLMRVEAPLTIACQIPNLENRIQVIKSSVQHLELIFENARDHDGWPLENHLSEFGPLSASWSRSLVLLSLLATQFDIETDSHTLSWWFVRPFVQLARRDGTLAFSRSTSQRPTDAFLETMAKGSNDRSDKQLLNAFSDNKASRKSVRLIESPAHISNWSDLALLQSTWELKSPTVAINYAHRQCQIEIGRSELLINGNTLPSVSINGVPRQPTNDFQIVCKRSDEDLDYLELEMQLESKVLLNRQFLLSRTDEFLLIADRIVARTDSRIDYRCQWPLADSIEGMRETETRELYLRNPKIQSLILPLALPEWKQEPTDDRLEFTDNDFSIVQSTDGRAIYVPLLFDLNPGRSRLKRTWRKLTVGENRKIVEPDAGCAFRFQLDRQQWFFYRALTSIDNRTYLGENSICEFAFHQLNKNGTVTQLIEIK